MAQFESLKAEVDASGAQVAFIAAEKRDGVWKPGKYLEKHPVSWPFLLDEDRTVIKAYGLHNPLALDAFNIAHPATLIVDRAGPDRVATVRHIYRGANQHDRAPMQDVIAAAKGT